MASLVKTDSGEKKTNKLSSVPKKSTERVASEKDSTTSEGDGPILQGPVMPKYEVLDEKIYDGPIKAMIALKVLVSGEITEASLTTLLNNLYSSAKVRKGFKYYNAPTQILIYAFTSKEKADSDMGYWIAMLEQSTGDNNPRITIKKEQIERLGAEPVRRFGLSEAKRKQIFYELAQAQDNAQMRALQKYPDPDPLSPKYPPDLQYYTARAEYQSKISEVNEQKVRSAYNLTKQQMFKIYVEGVTKEWPVPKL